MNQMQSPNTPAAQIGALEAQPLEQLIELYKNPQPNGPDLYAILAAISAKQKQAQAQAAVQRQMAMAQGQQQAQQPPVADQLVAQAQQTVAQERGVPAVMAAHGGVMHTYNNGGIVALRNGGAVAFDGGGDVEIRRILNKSPLMRTPEENEKLRAAGIELTSRKFAPTYSSGIDEALTAEKIRLETEKARAPKIMTAQQLEALVQPAPTAMTPQQMEGAVRPAQPESAYSSGIDAALAAERARRAALAGDKKPQASPAPAPAPKVDTFIPEEMGPDILDLLGGRRVEKLEGRKRLPEDIVRERAGLSQLMIDTLEERRKDIARRRTEEEKERDERVAAAKEFGPQSWFELAAGIDTRKGKWLGSTSGALSKILTDKQKKTEEAKKAFKDFEASERTEKNLLNQMDILERQRLLAEKTGDLRDVQAIDDKISDIDFMVEKLKQDRKEQATKLALEKQKLSTMVSEGALDRASRERQAAEGRIPAEVRLIEWLRDPANKKLYEDIQNIKGEENRRVKLYEVYTKNKLLLGDISFEDFVAGYKDAAGAGGAPSSVPPPGAVKLKTGQ